MLIDVIQWIVLGLLAGFIASKLINKRGEGVVMDVVLGIIGAVIGGWMFRSLGAAGATGFNLWSLMVAVVGAVVLLFIGRAVRHSFVRT
ncbi:MAG TPA: GlsB/YeaQ/YmgE family stress response membrane protein [Tepidisphaeraceae bacterium]|jgi:uncharacterized membrane protein YeaQ/YmgE (transglycosylase-associated protein family)|nr:GlsB/YeaQ/YmgE family stress response membrane protein [Tepidisphaeraceae bacterium]